MASGSDLPLASTHSTLYRAFLSRLAFERGCDFGSVEPLDAAAPPDDPLLPFPDGLAGPRPGRLPLGALGAFFPFAPLVDEGRLTVAEASTSDFGAALGRRAFPAALVPDDPPVLAGEPDLPAPDPEPALDWGRARSVRSTTGPLGPFFSVAVASRVGGVGGPPTMPRRNKISWVRIRIALETMK